MKRYVPIVRTGFVVVAMGLGLVAAGAARPADAGSASPDGARWSSGPLTSTSVTVSHIKVGCC